MHLIIDMDGTFLRNDFFQEILVTKFINNPMRFILDFRKIKNLIELKNYILNKQNINPDIIEYMVNTDVKNWISDNHHRFKSVNIVTASPEVFAKNILEKYNFTHIYGSQNINLKAENKLNFILSKFGENYCYIGDSKSDEVIFKKAKEAYKIKKFKIVKIK